MYHSESRATPVLPAAGPVAPWRAKVALPVYLIGMTSLLTDISAEMVASILPIYLFTVLRLSPFEYGLIDGLYNGSTAIIRLAAGYMSDYTRRHKAIAFTGYLLSAVSKFGLLFAGVAGWASVAAVLFVDRIGKGIRTAPRDTLIAQHATPDTMGAAFGVHRALDATGAMIGPLLATGILLWLPQRFDYVFMLSLCFAILGLLVIGLFVHPAQPQQPATAACPGTRITLAGTVHACKTPGFLLLLGASLVLSLFTLSDNMIYIGLQKQMGFAPSLIPLMFVATACVFMAMAVPVGKLADRLGHFPVFMAGYLMLAMVYCLFALLPPAGSASLAVYVVLIGTYYAATDGVVAAFAVKQLPVEMRTTGLACITTVMSLGRMGSSILFGWAWDRTSQEYAVGWFGAAMLLALLLAAFVMQRLKSSSPMPASPA